MPKTKIKSTQTLHALFVAINTYEENVVIDDMATFPRLSGCVADANAMLEFLKNDPGLTLNEKKLYNKDATKANIVKGIREHLGKAKPGDSVLLFYSGHGTVEEADPKIWPSETDGRLEGIVCYYTDNRSSRFVLADKELRFLLTELSEKTHAHILAIFDCCHSGDNTRLAARPGPTRKQVDIVFPRRPWSDFVFGTDAALQTLKQKGVAALLPEGRYVQIAACESNESALEDDIDGKRQGVLTAHLLRILRQTAGQLTYQDLVGRVRNQIRYQFGQRPKLYTPKVAADLANTGFLQKSPDASAATGTVDYDGTDGYLLNLGILHRVRPGHTTVQVKGTDGKWHPGRITKAELDHATVVFDPDQLDHIPMAAMPARVQRLDSRRLRIRLIDKDADPDTAQALVNALNAEDMQPWIELTDSAEKIDYELLCFGEQIYPTKPGDWFRPLVLPVPADDKNVAATLAGYLKQMAHWHFIKELENKSDQPLPLSLLKIEFLDQNDRPLSLKKDTLTLPLRQDGKDEDGRTNWSAGFKVRLTNQAPDKLYVAAAYLSDYGCNTKDLLEANTSTLLEKKEKTFLLKESEDQIIQLSLDDSARLFNHAGTDNFIQFIISSDRFDSGALELEPLPEPSLITSRGLRGEKGSITVGPKKPARLPKGWNVQTVNVYVPNPEFNKVDTKWLQKQLDPKTGNASLAHFLFGLYFDKKPGLNGELVLKKEMQPAEKGVFWDTALAAGNFWAHWRRSRQYDKMVSKYPKLPRFLAEGDSWFQHPLLVDIIDNIGRYYPVNCLSAAGDTIQHYYQEGDFFKKIAEMKPALLLLSGGGNDILGDEMPGFLHDTFFAAPEGEQPDRFFTAAFFATIDKIQGIYRQIFERLEKEYPKMPVLVHSYDYPRPLKAGSKASSWLGERFDAKKIAREGDRRAAVHHMIDEFNKRLQEVASGFKNVYYLDLRNRVADNQWDDEIHPNDAGFDRVAAVFLRKITELFPRS